MKICIVSSAGGHLKEMNRLLPILRKRDYFYITFAEDEIASGLGGRVYRVVNPDVRNKKLGPKAFAKNFMQVLRVLR